MNISTLEFSVYHMPDLVLEFDPNVVLATTCGRASAIIMSILLKQKPKIIRIK